MRCTRMEWEARVPQLGDERCDDGAFIFVSADLVVSDIEEHRSQRKGGREAGEEYEQDRGIIRLGVGWRFVLRLDGSSWLCNTVEDSRRC